MAKILLVEDDKSLREIYGVRLMAEGYTIVSAGDGEEALAMAIKERPDLIVSDVMMPKISGFDMLDILRSTTETKAIKVIMMTALSSEDQRARGEALGADRYLVKSQVGIEDVVRTVHDVLGDTIANAAPAPDFSQPAPVAPTPIEIPTPAPLPTPDLMATMPTPVAAPLSYAPPVAPVPIAYEQPVINIAPVPAPYVPVEAPVAAPIAPPTLDPVYQPAPEVYAAPAPVAMPAPYAVPAPIAPAPYAAPPVMAAPFAPAPAPAPYTTTPAILPEPTAPFSSPRPASLGDRVINPLPSAESLGQPGLADIATQMNQELNAHLQELQPVEAPVQGLPPQPPVPPLPPQPMV